MTEVPIDVGYRSYIRLLRKKWDIVYHSKDLYFSHANKILEPYYDMNSNQFYGIETNPTRLAIIRFIDQFRGGPGIYDTNSFSDPLKHSINYAKRVKIRKPYRAGRYQESHESLADETREEHYQFQRVQPKIRELRKEAPYVRTIMVEDHPYEKMIGRRWTHIYVPSPVDLKLMAECQTTCGYHYWLLGACDNGDDMIVVEPICTQFYVCLISQVFSWTKWALKIMYAMSIMSSCHRPHRWEWNLYAYLGISLVHVGALASLRVHPLAKYKLPDRFHDTEALNELKYFREFVPTIVHKVKVLFKDEQRQIEQPLRTVGALHLINLFVLGYNYLFGIDHWYAYIKT